MEMLSAHEQENGCMRAKKKTYLWIRYGMSTLHLFSPRMKMVLESKEEVIEILDSRDMLKNSTGKSSYI